MMKKKMSLKDIAREAGVSATLVSYVMNGKMLHRIKKETADKIRKTALKMNYRPNQIAQSLKNNSTQTIGLIVSDISNPYSSSIARIIEDEAKKSGYTVIFGSADENCEKASSLVNTLLARQVDGFIIAPPVGFEKQIEQLKKEGIPFVLIDRYFEGMDASHITINNFEAAREAVSHLVDNGYRNIGFINYTAGLFHLKERTRGYKEALKDAGIKVKNENVKLIDERKISDEIKTALDQLLADPNPIDAVFFSSSMVAIEGLAYLSKKKILVPLEVGIICFDWIKAYDLFPYQVTYVRQPMESIGGIAVDLLFKIIHSGVQSSTIILDHELIVRESSLKKK